jgi:hypothetical protein
MASTITLRLEVSPVVYAGLDTIAKAADRDRGFRAEVAAKLPPDSFEKLIVIRTRRDTICIEPSDLMLELLAEARVPEVGPR